LRSSLYPRHHIIYHPYKNDGNYRFNDFLGIFCTKGGGVQVAAWKTMPLARAAIYLPIYQKLHAVHCTT
jgi:hypothetical protein